MSDILHRLSRLPATKRSELLERFALSPSQRALWFLGRLDEHGELYVGTYGRWLHGALDVAGLHRALRIIVTRHEILRTRFPEVDGVPFQLVCDPDTFDFSFVDLSGISPHRRRGAVQRHAQLASRRRLPVDTAPPFRVTLLRESAHRHLLLFTVHHLITDAWSVTVLNEELAALYAAHREGRRDPLPPLPIQYLDYSRWLARRLDDTSMRRSLQWWQRYLDGAPTALALPLDHPRPPHRRFRGVQSRRVLERSVTRRVRAAARDAGTTVFSVLLAAIGVLLDRYTGQREVLIGVPVANRTHRDTEKLIGLFLSTLVLRVRTPAELGFLSLVKQVRESTLHALEHQEVPLELLVRNLCPERPANRNPLFQVLFTMQPEAQGEIVLGDLRVEHWQEPRRSAMLDLNFAAEDDGDEIRLMLEADRDLLRDGTVERMLCDLDALIAALTVDPARRLGCFPVKSAVDTHRLHAVAPALRGSRQPVHERILQRCATHGARTAVRGDSASLRYEELARHALDLAAVLARRGVGHGARVGLAMPRGPELVSALLGILAAGAAYVPLDPEQPPERLRLCIEDSKLAALVAPAALASLFAGTRVPLIEAQAGAGAAFTPAAHPAWGVRPAYLIHTSGSTGRPKGVLVQHGALAHALEAIGEHLGTGQDTRMLAATSLGFDIAALELLLPLLAGGCVEMADAEQARDPRALAELILRRRPDTVQATPSLWTALLEDPRLRLDGVTALCGGERLGSRLADAIRGRGARLVNLYGPTEATIWCSAAEIDEAAAGVPIGRPLAGCEAWVLDAAGCPVPPGALGELCVGGAGLAQGYFALPARTARSFVPHPHGREPGARLYRSGDLVRRRHDGMLEFVGRGDGQVKVRGHRIELGEVEAALEELHAVAQAVVLCDGGAGEAPRLCAFLSPSGKRLPTAEELRSQLAPRLPAPAIPSRFDWVAEIPLNSSGKIDRAALASRSWPTARARYAAPGTATERHLAAIWTQLLDVEKVGREDDFFALGGHSLLAVRMVARIAADLGVDLPLRAVFSHPVLSALAAAVRGARPAAAPEPLATAPPHQPQPLSPPQRGLWFLHRLEPTSAAYNTALALELRGHLDARALCDALDALCARHQSLRTIICEGAQEPLQRIAAPTQGVLRRVDLRAAPPQRRREARDRAMQEIARKPFDLAAGRTLRAALLTLDEDEHVLVLAVHHIVCDGWSFDLMISELAALYAGRTLAPAPQFLPLARVQREALAPGEPARLARWRERLRGVEPLELPLDRPRPLRSRHRGDEVALTLAAPQCAALLELAAARGATPFMALLATLAALLARVTAQPGVCVGTPVANREGPDAERVVGFLADTVPLALDLSDDPCLDQLVDRARECVLGALEDRVPFDRLVEALAPDRDLRRNPYFDVVLVVREKGGRSERFPGLEARTLPLGKSEVKFDLLWTFDLLDDGTVQGVLAFDRDLFDVQTVRALAHYFTVLVGSGAASPDRPISALPLQHAAQARETLAAVHACAATAPPAQRTLVSMFESQAAATPAATAVVWDNERVSYAELERRANRLARRLVRRGVQTGDAVGLLLERGIELVVSMLAIMKAGAAYVPLDPRLPDARIALQLRDCNVSLAVAGHDLAARVPGEIPSIEPAADAGADTGDAGPPSARAPHPRQVAYVLYTSGTTGRPKGVALEHAGAVALLEWARGVYAPAERAGLVAATSVGFDLSVFEIFLPLCTGGSVVLARTGVELPTGAARTQMRMLNTVPSTAEELLRDPQQAALMRGLETVNLAGEPLSADLVARLHAAGVQKVYDLYGPTEATTYATFCLRSAGAAPTIGHPIRGTVVYVLDRQGRLAPPGLTGEVYIGGLGLARGYRSDPALTAERFVPNPYARTPGERLYRTGDLARWRDDLSLVYLGRADRQVKLRGFRIELGEVESALHALPEVATATVDVRAVHEGERALVAWVVPGDDAAGDAGALAALGARLRTQLSRRLPSYMLPQHVVVLHSLPLTANGKLDRRALPDPREQPGAQRRPLTQVEATLIEIWSGVLGRGDLHPHSHFFEAGGSSLGAVRVASAIRAIFQVNLDLACLIENSVLEDQAAVIARALQAGLPRDEPPLRIDPARTRGPLTAAQQRLWLQQQLQPASSSLHQYGAVRIRGPLDAGLLREALAGLLGRHPALRTTFHLGSDGPVQHVHPAFALPLEECALDALAGNPQDAARERVVALGERPLDLEGGPAVRFALLRLGPRDHVLGVVAHHLVSDAWSFAVIFEELRAAMGGRGVASAPRPSPVDLARYERTRLSGARADAHRSAWCERLRGSPDALRLPLDRPREADRDDRAVGVALHFDADVVAAARRLARDRQATPFMVLLAAWKLQLAQVSGQDDIVVGSPFAQRDRPELHGAVAMLVNSIPLRTSLAGEPAFGDLVERVRDSVLFATRHAELPFEQIVTAAGAKRRPGVHPLFQVWFTYETDTGRTGGEDGWSAFWVERRRARHDLRLALWEREGQLRGVLDGPVALFDRSTLSAIAAGFVRTLTGCLAAPERRVREARVETAAEQ